MSQPSIDLAIEYIKRNRENLIFEWESRAKNEILAARDTGNLLLSDHLGELLDDLVLALEHVRLTQNPREFSTESFLKSRSQLHGESRSIEGGNYHVDELLEEYFILRQLLTDKLISEDLGNFIVIEAINTMLEATSLWAVKSFTEKTEEINQKIISTLVHDIRSPVGVAISALEILKDYIVDDEMGLKMYTMIDRSLERSLTMISSTLDSFSTQYRSKLTLHFEKFNLSTVVTSVLTDLQQVYGNNLVKGIIDSNCVGIFAQGLLERVLENLISNAFKFGFPLSEVTVSLNEHEDSVELLVHNWGNPISKKRLAEIFESYQTTSEKVNDVSSGWGLGLSHIKLAASAHGGQVVVTSSKENGTEFKLMLKKYSHDVGKEHFRL